MYKATVDLGKSIVSVQNYNTPDEEVKIYKDSDLRLFYPEQIIEIHTIDKTQPAEKQDVFLVLLPLGLTSVEWVNHPKETKKRGK